MDQQEGIGDLTDEEHSDCSKRAGIEAVESNFRKVSKYWPQRQNSQRCRWLFCR
jgi:hypothetical protein